MSPGKLIMMNKRKINDELDNEDEAKRRRRMLSRSPEPPLSNEDQNPEKREALKRLFGRYCSLEENHPRDSDESDEEFVDVIDENDDPLLDTVPVHMEPEQLGFLVCAQETLRFLHGRGLTAENPVFARLRSRLLQGIEDITTA